MADVLDVLTRAGAAAREATARAADLRRARDDLILQALSEGHGVRETARAAGVEPNQVARVRDR